MSLSADRDTLISLLESFVLSENKTAFIKTLVPNSVPHKVFLSFLELTQESKPLSEEVIGFLSQWRKANPIRGTHSYNVFIRMLLKELDQEQNPAKVKELITQIDRATQNIGSSFNRFQKPVIFTAGDEFKEEKEQQLTSTLTATQESQIQVKGYVEAIHQNPALIHTLGNQTLFPHLNLEKLAESSPAVFSQLLDKCDNFVSLQVDFADF